ncbi:MAG: Rieske (2Fe-2S) protein [Alphaproteobacteria bacterium]|nr:Rieske (2Fe-2S) protein [Alphaproteobacteria bacterium]
MALDALPDGEARGVAVAADGGARDLIVVRRGGRVYAYVDVCPHLGTPLETFPDRFLDLGKRHLLCTTHGARFRIEDGRCVFGPCLGKSLASVPVAVVDGAIVLAGPVPPAPEPQR